MSLTNYQRNIIFYFILGSIIILIFFIYGSQLPGSDLETSRLASIESLANKNSWAVTDSNYIALYNKDIIKIGDEFYSSKPPVFSWLASWDIKFWQLVLGQNMAAAAKLAPVNIFYYLLLVGFVIFPYLLGLVAASKILNILKINRYRWLMLIVLALASLWFVYLFRFTNHVAAAGLLLLAAYFIFKYKLVSTKPVYIVWAGLIISLAVVFELALLWLWFLVSLYFFIKERNVAIHFILGSLPLFILHLWLTYSISGQLLPFYFVSEFYNYSGSYWLSPQGIDALTHNKFLYAFNLLVGSHGLWFYSPIYIFSILGLVKGWRNDNTKITVLFTMLLFLGFILFYVFGTNNYGGAAYGWRWSIVLTPVLWLWLVFYLQSKPRLNFFIIGAIIWSVLATGIGLINPLGGSLALSTGQTIYWPWLVNLFTIFN